MRVSQLDPTKRFSERVQNYVRYRPGYPAALTPAIAEHCALASGARVAELGAGTGILTGDLLAAGFRVVAVEPNAQMLRAAQVHLGGHQGFEARQASAEATGLDPESVDAVVAAQAFHWFDVPKVRAEVMRIGGRGVAVALVWNSRRLDRTEFLRAYEAHAHRWGRDYEKVAARYADPEALDALFGEGGWRRYAFDNEQRLTREGLLGRLESCSYLPMVGDADFDAMRADAEAMFERHAREGWVEIEYDTELFVGRVG